MTDQHERRAPSYGLASSGRARCLENSDAGTCMSAEATAGDPVTATDADGHTPTYALESDRRRLVPDRLRERPDLQTEAGVTYDFETKSRYSVIVKADRQQRRDRHHQRDDQPDGRERGDADQRVR